MIDWTGLFPDPIIANAILDKSAHLMSDRDQGAAISKEAEAKNGGDRHESVKRADARMTIAPCPVHGRMYMK